MSHYYFFFTMWFVDGAIRPIFRRRKDQRILYNNHKKVHVIKFQSVAAPNGLIATLYGLVDGQCHDSGMFGESGLFWDFQQYAHESNNNILCLYGDLTYCFQPQITDPFQGGARTPLQIFWNIARSQLGVLVEIIFGEILD